MKNKHLLSVLSLYFIFIAIIYVSKLYTYAVNYDGYIIADWLIDFSAGFVRRGLSGYLITSLSDLIHIKANFIVMGIQLITYVSFIRILFCLLKKKEINIWVMILLFSPVILLFPVLSYDAVGRKEITLFLLFSLFVFQLNKNPRLLNPTIFFYSLALTAATLLHELVFFYTPYFLLAVYLNAKVRNEKFQVYPCLLLIAMPFLAMFFIYFYGKDINAAIICSGLIQRGMPQNICSGILSFDNQFGKLNVFEYFRLSGYYLSYGMALVLGLVPFIFYTKYPDRKIISVKSFTIAFSILFLCSAPLFIMGVDWGRWLNIHFVLLLLICIFLLKNKPVKADIVYENSFLKIPVYVKSASGLTKLNSAILIIITVAYLSFWSMEIFGSFSVFSFPYYVKIFKGVHKIMEILH